MQIVEWLFYTPLGQSVLMWVLIILGALVGILIFLYLWTMFKGGIPSWALYVKGGARFGRMYKCTDTDEAIEIGDARFLKPVHAAKDKDGNPLLDERGESVMMQTNPPISFWRRLKAAKLYLVAEGVAQVLSWHALINKLSQTALTPQQLKDDPQVKAVVAAVNTFGKGHIGTWTIVIMMVMAFAVGGFMMLALAATGVIPIG